MTTTDDIIAALRRAVPDGSLLDEAADALEAERKLADDAAQLLDELGWEYDNDGVRVERDAEAVAWLARYREARA